MANNFIKSTCHLIAYLDTYAMHVIHYETRQIPYANKASVDVIAANALMQYNLGPCIADTDAHALGLA